MILRRVIAHFRKQEWTAIALDFLIVIFGILIAFQVTEWNQARRDRALEREYVERLHADLESTLAPRQSVTEWNATRLEQQALVLGALRSGVLADQDREAFEQGLALFGFVGGLDVRWATVDELRSTGALNIISDVNLRSLILRIDAELQRRQGIAARFMDSIYAHRHHIGDRYGVVDYTGERNTIRLQYDFQALAADPGFINELSQVDFLSRFRLDLAEGQLVEITELRDELTRWLNPESDSAR